jgi:hypothetical protein
LLSDSGVTSGEGWGGVLGEEEDGHPYYVPRMCDRRFACSQPFPRVDAGHLSLWEIARREGGMFWGTLTRA